MATSDSTTRFDETQLGNEEWRDITGYEGIYQVSSLGRIKRVKGNGGTHAGRIMKTGESKSEYRTVTLSVNSIKRTFALHRLVASAFLGEPPTSEHQINHINSNKYDNRLCNLEWITRFENMQHAFAAKGRTYLHRNREQPKRLRHPRAEKQHILPKTKHFPHTSKLTWEIVGQIRRLHDIGYTYTSISIMYGIATSTVYSIANMNTWKEQYKSSGYANSK